MSRSKAPWDVPRERSFGRGFHSRLYRLTEPGLRVKRLREAWRGGARDALLACVASPPPACPHQELEGDNERPVADGPGQHGERWRAARGLPFRRPRTVSVSAKEDVESTNRVRAWSREAQSGRKHLARPLLSRLLQHRTASVTPPP